MTTAAMASSSMVLPISGSADRSWPTEKVKLEGAATAWARVGDDGMTITFRFCATCVATVYFDIDGMPGFIAVPVGAFADPSFPAPSFSMYEARKHAWVKVPEDIEHLD